MPLFVQAHTAEVPRSYGKSGHTGGKETQLDARKTGSKDARDEIQAYVAIRDLLLSDAEVTTTPESLRRADKANEFVETCLQPPRTPYEAQYLREIDAVRQRERCNEARGRIAKLRQKLQTD